MSPWFRRIRFEGASCTSLFLAAPSRLSRPTPTATVPPSITRAVRVMYVGAAASVIGIIVDLTTYSSLQNALATRKPRTASC